MKNDVNRKKWGFVILGIVGALSLGAIGIASAATGKAATPSPSATAQAGGVQAPDGDRDGHVPDGDRDGRGFDHDGDANDSGGRGPRVRLSAPPSGCGSHTGPTRAA